VSRFSGAEARNGWIRWRAGLRLDLARHWLRHDDFDEAHIHLARAVRLLRAAPPDPRRNGLLVRALTELGDEHRRRGRYPQATALLRDALELAGAGADPGQLAATLTVLGITAKELGAYREAERCYAEVENLFRAYAFTLTDQATLLHNLAGLAYARQRFPQAEAHARHAVRLRREVRTATVELAADLAVLGAAITAQGRHDEAREHLRRALGICREARPPRRYEIAVQLHNLASVDHADGHLDTAEQGFLDALKIKEQLLGADHPEVGVICNNLGTLRHDQNRHDEARDLYLRALAATEHAYPPGHPTVTAIRHNLRRT
jgi:tetratricopeptide (TPR) repeat protein